MREDFVHFIWQYQKFSTENLVTVDGQKVCVLKTGYPHQNAGPDFQEAKIVIDSVEWAGSVEIHLRSSDWFKHNHHEDDAYQNVILHVVWDYDQPVYYSNGSEIPTIALKKLVAQRLVEEYSFLQLQKPLIPCQDHFFRVSDLVKSDMLETTLTERLMEKSMKAHLYLRHHKNDWEQLCFFMLCSTLGGKVNQAPMEHLASLIPYKLLLQYRGSLTTLEAILFGAAGFLLADSKDDYPNKLRQEWLFMQQKHSDLFSTVMQRKEWKFLRLRPANFPTIRLAQLAVILHQTTSLFTLFVNQLQPRYLKQLLSVEASAYWTTHYKFDVVSKSEQPKILGKNSVSLILINAVAPILALYGKTVEQEKYLNKAFELLQTLPAEKNTIANRFKKLGAQLKSAYDSQAFLQLHNGYCVQRDCLSCKIGLSILNR